MMALYVLLICFKILGFLAVIAMVMIGTTLGYDLIMGYSAERKHVEWKESVKRKLREEKEQKALEGGFFSDSLVPYVPGFDGKGELLYRGRHMAVDINELWEECRKLDELADADIFKNTEEL